LDTEPLKDWIGRSETVRDHLTGSLIDRYRATLDPYLWSDVPVPLGLHWCLGLAATPMGELSEDGHTKRGAFLPPVPLPSRMWAGGEVVHHHALALNAPVTRTSTISDITAKQGKSGDLVFVTVSSEFHSGDKLCISERQDIVFRELSTLGAASAKPAAQNAGTRHDTLVPDPVMLFRFSALTFNSHRIHYDQQYARDVEGYPDLVVHGPLQATVLLNLAAKIAGRSPHRFAFRGVAPVTLGAAIEIRHDQDSVWCQNADGIKSFVAHYSDE